MADPFTWMAAAQVFSSVMGALTYKTPSPTYSAQEKEFLAQIERYKGIREKRQAAITIAASISGLPESTFYGRKGAKLLESTTVPVGMTQEQYDKATEAMDGAKQASTRAADVADRAGQDKQYADTVTGDQTASRVYGAVSDANRAGQDKLERAQRLASAAYEGRQTYAEAMQGRSGEIADKAEEARQARTPAFRVSGFGHGGSSRLYEQQYDGTYKPANR